MSFIDSVRTFFALAPLQERSEGSIEDLAARLTSTSTIARPWRAPSIRESLGVPAAFRAYSLISNTVGTLSFIAYQAGVRVTDERTPRVVKRPNPFTVPRVFFRDSAAYLAGLGETWWWVAKRDSDNQALSVIPVDPREVLVEEDPTDLRYPIVRWKGVKMRREDFRQITYLRDPNNPLRGWGPLQACGAAVSVAVESQEWAANFYAGGGIPSIIIKSATELAPGEEGEAEADLLRAQWMEKAHNVPRVIDPGIESVDPFGVNPEAAQMMDARMHDVGEMARAFGMPGPLLEYSAPGSSLTYTNKEGLWTEFQQSCLTPNYLEPMEQEFSDLLVRSMTVNFDISRLLRADAKTRFEIYQIGVPLGIIPKEEAQAAEGYAPGNLENRAVPPAPPAAIPSVLPIQLRARVEATEVRCTGKRVRNGVMVPCNRILGRLAAPYEVQCPRCQTTNAAA